MRSLVAVVACLAGLAGCATSQLNAERTFRRSIRAGHELRVYTFEEHRPGCTPGTPPRIVIETPPAHGTVELRPGSITVRETSGTEDCTGKVLPGIGVWYTPAPGFHGPDTFDFQVFFRDRIFHDTAQVQVR